MSELPSNAVPTQYAGYYVTPEGDVWSTHSNRKMKPRNAGRGYRCIQPKGAGHRGNVYVHRLVAETLLDNPEGKTQVNHIDGDKTNNAVDNLEWNTQAENMKHARDERLFSRPSWADLTDWQLMRGYGMSTYQIAKEWGASTGTVWYQLNRAKW